ncbi:MAG: hypothetical protein IKA02_04300, partial [Clostridia bacterium]|nr:hypothetical protein [Clostridia bacterium]
MKKLILILLLILVSIFLSSCNSQQINTDTDTNAQTAFENFKPLDYMIENSVNFKCKIETVEET